MDRPDEDFPSLPLTAAPVDSTVNATINTFAQTPAEAEASAEASDNDVPHIPGYDVRRKLGEGGMGVVYLARQRGLNRDVAIKTLIGSTVSRATLARFWAEAEVMAEVRHPNVVQVIELGESDGQPFMAMEFVKGGSLTGRLRGGVTLPAREAAALVERIARGVAAAHDLGVVHRDLKPDNVLIDGDTPKVADFGIAKRKTHAITNADVMLGTPAYMSPEQAASQSKHVGPTADVWSLGVMLYECLSARRPFEGESSFDVIIKIAREEPVPLRERVSGVPRDLHAIVAKCLTKEPELRYPTAKELADDLARFTRGEPIAARPLGPAERVARWVWRNPTAAAACAVTGVATALALVTFTVVGFWREAEGANTRLAKANEQLFEANERTKQAAADALTQKGIADENAADARKQKEAADGNAAEALKQQKAAEAAQAKEAEARRALEVAEYGRTVQLAHQEWRDNNVVGALALLDGVRPELRGWEWHYVHRLCHGSLLTLKGHVGKVSAVAFRPDGKQLVTAGADGTVRVWDARTGAQVRAINGHVGGALSAAFDPDGKHIVSGGADGAVRVWGAETGTERPGPKWNLRRVTTVSFNSDGAKVLAAGADGAVRVWDVATGATQELDGHRGAVNAAAFSPDGSRVVTGGDDGTVRMWELAAGKAAPPFATLPDGVRAVAFSRDNESIVTTGGPRHAVLVWNAQTGERKHALGGHQDAVLAVAFGPGNLIVTAGQDRTILVWDGRAGALAKTVRGHTGAVHSVAFAPDGSRVATADDGGAVKVWGANTDIEVNVNKGLSAPQLFGRFRAADAVYVRAATGQVIDALSKSELAALVGYSGQGALAAYSPNGKHIVTSGAAHTAVVWDAQTKKALHTLTGHTGDVNGAAFSPNGRRVATASDDNTAKVWDAETGKEVCTLRGHTRRVRSVAFSPDGAFVVTASDDDTARVWDARTGEPRLALRGHAGPVRSAEFGPGGARVVTASDDRTAKLWDARTGDEVLTLKGHAEGVVWAAFTFDGAKVVTRVRERDDTVTTRIWDASSLDRTFAPRPVAPPPRPRS